MLSAEWPHVPQQASAVHHPRHHGKWLFARANHHLLHCISSERLWKNSGVNSYMCNRIQWFNCPFYWYCSLSPIDACAAHNCPCQKPLQFYVTHNCLKKARTIAFPTPPPPPLYRLFDSLIVLLFLRTKKTVRMEYVHLTSSNYQIQNVKATRGFILISHKS